MNRLTVISKNINKREINMVVVHSFADAHKEAQDAMERGCDEAIVEDEVHNVVLRLIKPKKTNFDRITESPEKMAEFIADVMFLYSTNRHIFIIEAVKMASKKEKIDINLDYIYKDIVKWLNEESKE